MLQKVQVAWICLETVIFYRFVHPMGFISRILPITWKIVFSLKIGKSKNRALKKK